MTKPRLIILIRHGQSEGNKNRDIHQTIPDHRVKLTPDGWKQAYDAGRRLRRMLRPDDTLHFFTSPYRRTRETTEGILSTLTADGSGSGGGGDYDSASDAEIDHTPSPFRRENIKVYEEPRLREQDFGNFQPCSAAMERMWQERADYGHFFYRIPNGESAADAYDRISGFNESLWRQFGEDGFASVCVLVTHGLMSRVFLMKWYHFTVEYFEDLRNINHCEFLVMRRDGERDKYILQNKLRTWSELKQERALTAAAAKAREAKSGNGENGAGVEDEKKSDVESANVAVAVSSSSSPVEPRRRWGGCPNGCSHDKSFKIRKVLADLIKCDSAACNDPQVALPSPTAAAGGSNSSSSGTAVASNTSLASRRPAARRFLSSQSIHDPSNEEDDTPLQDGNGNGTDTGSGVGDGEINVRKAREDIVSSPDGTPSYISVDHRLLPRSPASSASPRSPKTTMSSSLAHRLLHVGRDGGGTYSGHNSAAVSDADSSEDERHRRRLARLRAAAASGSNGNLAKSAAGGVVSPGPTANDYGEEDGDDEEATPEAEVGEGSGDGLLPPQSAPYSRHQREQSGMGRGTRANKLGDAPHSSDGEHDADGEDDIARAEKEDQSIEGSVY